MHVTSRFSKAFSGCTAVGAARRAAAVGSGGGGGRSDAGNGHGVSAAAQSVAAPPVAVREPTRVLFGRVEGENRGADASALMSPPRVIEDEYFWMRDDERKDPRVIKHLELENEYTASMTAPLKAAEDALYVELLSHVKETDAGAPYRYGEYEYYTRTVAGKSYSIHCRRRLGGAEEIVLDVNKVAEGTSYCDVECVAVSPSHRLLAYSVDTSGYETYVIKFVNLETGEPLADVLEETDGDIEWGMNDNVVFYARMDSAHRPHTLWVHALGSDVANDVCLFTENDELYWLSFGKPRSNDYLSVSVHSKETAEVRVLKLDADWGATTHIPTPEHLVLVAEREYGVRYSVRPWRDYFFVRSNVGAKNYQLMIADAADVLSGVGRSAWRAVPAFPYDATKTIAGVDVFEKFLAVYGRKDGLTRLWLLSLDASAPACVASAKMVGFEDEAYTVYGSVNKVFDTDVLRIVYSSMTQPPVTMDVDVKTDKRTIIKQKEVPGYEKALYGTKRIIATARDGTSVPISLVYRTDKHTEGAPAPLMLYGYGSYGSCMEPDFSSARLPLLDRGMVYAIAHIRGGGEMGREWYEDHGKFLAKLNTFHDFIDCAEHLIANKYTSPSLLATTGRSAGGLLMGTVLNMRPDLFRAAVAGVPFVDLMVTMCDASIPLTVTEWEGEDRQRQGSPGGTHAQARRCTRDRCGRSRLMILWV